MTSSQSYNEKELLKQLATGSEAAFRTLFDTYRDKLYTYIFKLSGSVETAEDTVHDVFLKLWLQREQLPEIDNLNAYLYKMAHNISFTLFRRMAKETLILAEIGREHAKETAFEGEDNISQQEVLHFIREAVSQLTPLQKTIFVMSREQGLKLADIAQQLDLSEQTVKNRITEAMRFLREEIGRQYGPTAVILYVLYDLAGY